MYTLMVSKDGKKFVAHSTSDNSIELQRLCYELLFVTRQYVAAEVV